jgi:hypothetical protein
MITGAWPHLIEHWPALLFSCFKRDGFRYATPIYFFLAGEREQREGRIANKASFLHDGSKLVIENETKRVRCFHAFNTLH